MIENIKQTPKNLKAWIAKKTENKRLWLKKNPGYFN